MIYDYQTTVDAEVDTRMKDLFPGYFADNEEELRLLWKDSLLVFDANVLINLYKYSDAATVEFLQVLENQKQRIWLANRVAEEFFTNRVKVLVEQSNQYEKALKDIKSLQESFDNKRMHPHVSEKMKIQMEELFDSLNDELIESKRVQKNRLKNDHIKNNLSLLFDGRVGHPFSKDDLAKIFEEGEARYLENIPPGYEDAHKANSKEGGRKSSFSDKCRIYGDYIIWLQILREARSSDKNVIFVTDDAKNDWWEQYDKTTVGPRPELIKEFYDETNKQFYMYKSDQFMHLAKEYLNETITDGTLAEIHELLQREEKEVLRERFSEANYRTNQIEHRFQECLKQSSDLKILLEIKMEELSTLRQLGNDSIIIEQLEKEISGLQNEKSEIDREIEELKGYMDSEMFRQLKLIQREIY